VKAEGLAKAEAESTMQRQIGVAEADAIRAKGEAEAEARRLLAEALKLYNEAGLSIEALKVLPEIAAAVSEPLARAGSTTIISNGSAGSGTGTGKMTEDVVQVLGQLRPIMQQLAGVDLDQFLQGISHLPGSVSQRLAGPEEDAPSGSSKE
jgi:flotillin